jgi:hypothetical protein
MQMGQSALLMDIGSLSVSETTGKKVLISYRFG